MPKKSIRASMLAHRRHLSPAACVALSHRAQARFLESPEFAESLVLALYSSVANEVFTEEICQVAFRYGKRVAYPRISKNQLEFVEITSLGELNPGAFNILEPTGNALLDPAALDLMLVPGVAFDLQGFRLGYGKGYYDRFLHSVDRRFCLVGFCFDFQLLNELPIEFHDIGMDMLVTEERTLHFQNPEK